MEKQQRSKLQTATQDARRLLEEEFRSQLLQTYDIDVEKVRWAEEPGAHLQAEQRLIREKLVAWIEHKEAQINDRKEALLLALREMAFTALNRFVALKLMEARELVRPCVSGGLESAGFLEFTAVAQGLLADQESSYRLYLETIFEDVSRELRALFDPRDPASLLWPKRAALLELLDILNRPELAELWIEDETLGWVYQYFNGDAERKKMREESSAPRNSRELAVRNQFFTPRYVVEFLTDNTLGRIWYEMRHGQTGLKDRCRYLVRRPNEIWLQPAEEPPAQADADEALSQEELMRQPVHITHRPLRDPREIRMLDPACGSMHFGLYAFDLYLEIYAEAWVITQESEEPLNQSGDFASFAAYAAGFADKASFEREVPRLILQNNIHGIDIDPRATQIARLTLWLRAQRAWKEQQLQVVDRPPIIRSNIVCAEPMPGERELLADFVDKQFQDAERGLAQQLLEAIFDKMQLAGEVGSLLKIEEEVRGVINHARREWQKLAIHQKELFSTTEPASHGLVTTSLKDDLQHLTEDFWVNIEERIYAALHDYAAQDQIGRKMHHRLFAEDAAQGFAFIDVCRMRYDVTLMNPPFGDPSVKGKEYIFSRYPKDKTEQYACFIAQGIDRGLPSAYLGALSSRTGYFLTTLKDWRRERLLDSSTSLCDLFLDLGGSVLDGAAVECAAITATRHSRPILALKLNGSPEPFKVLGETIRQTREGCHHELVYSSLASDLLGLPDSPFAYFLPSRLRASFKDLPRLSSFGVVSKQGIATSDNTRFLRLRWEVSARSTATGGPWITYSKGGTYSPYYTEFELLLNWDRLGEEVKAFSAGIFGTWAKQITNTQFFGKKGLTYPRRTSNELGPAPLPCGSGFDVQGSCLFYSSEVSDDALLALCAIAASRAFNALLRVGLARTGDLAKTYPESLVSSMPVPKDIQVNALAVHAKEASLATRSFWMLDETSISFIKPFSSTCSQKSLADLFQDEWNTRKHLHIRLCEIARSIDEKVISAYGFQGDSSLLSFFDEDLGRIDPNESDRQWKLLSSEIYLGQPRDFHDFKQESLIGLLSYFLGVAFGRWNVLHARDDLASPAPPQFFSPLPVCSPSQLQNEHGFPACSEDIPADYPISIPWDGILVDDPNHPLELERCIHKVIEVIWNAPGNKATAKSIEHEACQILRVVSLRDYFRKPNGFFAEHLKRYSKSRRQAPIYWQLSTGNGSYSAWLYYHRFTQDTLYRVLRDFVEPRIQQAERDQFELESQVALLGDAATRLQDTHTLLEDLRIFKSELDLVAPLWNPNLNDGVIINHAILWRITPYTPWQKKCKECWDKLVKGDYDWAHFAFHLWPERVIPKCVTDRSLAIAHGLEERLWQETNNGKWLPRQLSEAELRAIIAEHSNPAVKSALERFLAAPPPVAPTRTRASRSTRVTGSSTPRRARGSAAVVDAEATRQVLLALTAAPSDGLAKAAIADLIGVEANALTAVIKKLKESGQIDQLGERRGARYVLSEQGRAAVTADVEGEE